MELLQKERTTKLQSTGGDLSGSWCYCGWYRAGCRQQMGSPILASIRRRFSWFYREVSILDMLQASCFISELGRVLGVKRFIASLFGHQWTIVCRTIRMLKQSHTSSQQMRIMPFGWPIWQRESLSYSREYGLFQCSQHCHPKTYQDDALVRIWLRNKRTWRFLWTDSVLSRMRMLEINKRNAEKEWSSQQISLRKRHIWCVLKNIKRYVLLRNRVGFTTPQFIKRLSKCVQANRMRCLWAWIINITAFVMAPREDRHQKHCPINSWTYQEPE